LRKPRRPTLDELPSFRIGHIIRTLLVPCMAQGYFFARANTGEEERVDFTVRLGEGGSDRVGHMDLRYKIDGIERETGVGLRFIRWAYYWQMRCSCGRWCSRMYLFDNGFWCRKCRRTPMYLRKTRPRDPTEIRRYLQYARTRRQKLWALYYYLVYVRQMKNLLLIPRLRNMFLKHR
jgi:hypothetical protein